MGITTLAAYENMGIHCIPVPVDELQKANAAVGCMTGILHRKMEKKAVFPGCDKKTRD